MLSYNCVTVNETVGIASLVLRAQLILFAILGNYCVEISYSHPSNLDGVRRYHVPFSNLALVFKEIINLATQLWIFIEVREMRFGKVYLSSICILFFLFMFNFICLGCLPIIDSFIHLPLLLLCLVELFQHLRGNSH